MRTVTGTPIFKADKYENIRDLILTSCEKHATLDAFIFRRNPKLSEVHRTYYEFGEDIKSLCAYISQSPYRGDKLAVVGENCYEWFVSYISILSTDSIGVPLDRMLPEEELITLLERSGSKVLFYHPKHHSMMVSIASKIKEGSVNLELEKFVCMYPDGLSSKETFPDDDDRFERFDDLIAAGKKIREEKGDTFLDIPIHSEEARIILFTSGTTSMSKGVLLSHKNICTNVHSITQTLYVVAGDRAFSILPLHHTFENTVDMFMLSVGVCLCLADGLRYIVPNLKEWHPEVCISVPLLYENIYQKIESGIEESGKKKLIDIMIPVTKFLKKFGIDIRRAIFKEILDKLGGDIRMVVIGGAGIDKRYIDAFTNFGIDFFMGYGLTETSPVISVTSTDCNVHGSVGRPLPAIEAAIDTEDTSKNAVGEIITRSDCVMLGYYKNEEATKEVLTPDGWFHTGDMGYIDKTGSIHITGRVKSMIVLTNGKKAFPEEIEALVCEIKGVNEAFVWGNKNDREAIDICAKLLIDRKEIGRILNLKGVPTDEEISAYLNDSMYQVNHKMPAYKIVRNFVFSEQDMIKTTTLKIKRTKEQEAIESLLASASTNMREMNGTNLDRLVNQ
ncbi:long-chain acyl-CoA synthetase [Ruminococcaceae bacterium KH2T8]|nr:long-chain acyl-CoA synthetase [Ruminococcaceae bacterium KH2T8]